MPRELPTLTIADRRVGAGEPTYVIAEIGSNHNRDWDTAVRLIAECAAAGADAVKFQVYSGATIYSRKTPKIASLAAVSEQSATDLLEDISLPRDWLPRLHEEAARHGVHCFATAFDLAAVDELAAAGNPVLKIASFEIVDVPLIRKAASTGLPVLISTGMATMGEIEDAVRAAQEAGAGGVGLMQCTSLYPAEPHLINLRAMDTMARAFEVPVGFSDHTLGISVPIAAAALGAAFVEKHVTLDKTQSGPDHGFALEMDELAAMVQGIREAQASLGDPRKSGPMPEELTEAYPMGRRSLVLVRDLPAGTRLEREMLTSKRPGLGIPPRFLEHVVGRSLRVDAVADDVLTWDMM
jgi:sialic acid synthase SpsE